VEKTKVNDIGWQPNEVSIDEVAETKPESMESTVAEIEGRSSDELEWLTRIRVVDADWHSFSQNYKYVNIIIHHLTNYYVSHLGLDK